MARLLTLVFLIPVLSFSQVLQSNVNFIHYEVEDGLPSDETYHVMQDSRGFIWISTDHGAARFDGKNFVVYSTRNGLPDDVIFRTFEDSKGRIWFVSFNGKLSYLQDEKVHLFRYNDLLLETLVEDPVSTHFHVDSAGAVWIGYTMNGLIKIDSAGVLTKPGYNPDLQRQLIVYEEGKMIGFGKSTIDAVAKNIDLNLNITLFGDSISDTIESQVNNVPRVNLLPDSTLSVTVGSDQLYLVNKHEIKAIEMPGWAIGQDLLGESLWVGMISTGVMEVKIDRGKVKMGRHWLPSVSVSSSAMDASGGCWFTSLEKGVYYCPNPSINSTTVNARGEPISVLRATLSEDEKEIYFCDRASDLYKIDSVGALHELGRYSVIQGMIPLGKGLCISGGGLKLIDESGHEQLISVSGINSQIDYDEQTNRFVGGLTGGCMLIDGNLPPDSNRRIFKVGRVFRAIFETEQTALLAGFNGVDRLDLTTGELTKFVDIKGRVEDIALLNGELFAATRNNGLFIMGRSGTQSFGVDDGLPSNTIYFIRPQPRSTSKVWLGTRNGLCLMEEEDGKWNFSSYDQSDGLLSNRVTALEVGDSMIVVGTKKGLNVFALDDLTATKELRIYLDSIKVSGGRITYPEAGMVLSDLNNTIEFFISGTCLHCSGKSRYAMNLNGEPYTNESGYFVLNALAPGDYELQFSVRDTKKGWEPLEQPILITILPPFWKRWTFILPVGLLLALLLILIMRRQNKKRLERAQMLNDINAYQQKALSLQMKPHFIFNSMNSIQNLILKEDKRQAHKYISSFARLMRRNLEDADSELISLSDELEVIQTYFELEQRRFAQEVKFEKEIDTKTDPSEIGVPPFILQPLIENCFWHGFSKEPIVRPTIRLIIKEGNSVLNILLQDNGIGIIRSKENLTSGNSKSSAILQSRLKLLEKKHNYTANFHVIDLSRRGEHGTQVVFTLPLLKNFTDEEVKGDNY